MNAAPTLNKKLLTIQDKSADPIDSPPTILDTHCLYHHWLGVHYLQCVLKFPTQASPKPVTGQGQQAYGNTTISGFPSNIS